MMTATVVKTLGLRLVNRARTVISLRIDSLKLHLRINYSEICSIVSNQKATSQQFIFLVFSFSFFFCLDFRFFLFLLYFRLLPSMRYNFVSLFFYPSNVCNAKLRNTTRTRIIIVHHIGCLHVTMNSHEREWPCYLQAPSYRNQDIGNWVSTRVSSTVENFTISRACANFNMDNYKCLFCFVLIFIHRRLTI